MRKIAVVFLIALAACGGRPDLYASSVDRHPRLGRGIQLPPPEPATPLYSVRTDRPLREMELRRVRELRGAVTAAVSVDRIRVRAGAALEAVRVAAIDALDYRSVAPRATRDADFVWMSLLGGDAVLTFDAARRLGLTSGGTIDVPRVGEVQVGAFATTGYPELADVLIDATLGDRAQFEPPRLLIVGARLTADARAIRDRLRELLPGARIARLLPQPPAVAASAPEAVGHAQAGLIGTMSYRVLRNGFIEPDPNWVAGNIATGTVPVLGTVTCHRVLFPQLIAALSEIERQGLDELIDVSDYGGCYVPRFIDRDPNKPLSMHAFGLAIDLNVSHNQLGTRGSLDPRIVVIFERWGFYWGGRFERPDPMHFELTRLIRT